MVADKYLDIIFISFEIREIIMTSKQKIIDLVVAIMILVFGFLVLFMSKL